MGEFLCITFWPSTHIAGGFLFRFAQLTKVIKKLAGIYYTSQSHLPTYLDYIRAQTGP